MRVAEVANRYAKALFEIAQEAGKAEQFYGELSAVEKSFNESESLQAFVLSPLVQSSEKEKVLKAALSDAKASPEVASFLLLLAQKGRLPLIHDVVVAYQSQMDEAAGVIRGTVTTAHKLDSKDQDEVKGLLSQLTNSDVVLNFEENNGLVAGLTAQVGSLTIDDCIQSHLTRMRDELNRSTH